jgi:glutaredoxin
LPALGISLYLTSISLWEIQATCFYCLTSLSLMVIVVVILAMQGRRMPGISWPGWLSATGGLAAAIVLLLHLHYSGVFSPAAGPEDPYLRGLAYKLTESGVKMYGASWCPHCQAQKALFGSAAAHLPYVECSPNGPNAPSAPVCVAQGVESYPTWIFPNDRHSGEIPVEELAQRVGYPPRPKGN